jgi:cyclophilin family peptidyl-prolyl cis-trans isomerase/HEAT repeat protein
MSILRIAAAALFIGLVVSEAVTLPAQAQACSDLTREGIILAADRRLSGPCASQDLDLLTKAAASTDIEFRRLAVQAFGRTGAPSMAPRAFPLLDDPSPIVRAEAANAIGQALSGTRSDLRDDAPPTAAEVTAGRVRLDARLEKETDDKVSAVILATIGRMRHDATELTAIEELLVAETNGSPDRLVGAAKGFESFTRRNPRRPLTEPARARLRDLAGLGRTATGANAETLTRLRRLVLTTLQIARDTDTVTMLEAAEDPDWQVRRIAAQMMNPAIDRLRPSVITLLKDPSLHVRVDAVRTFARGLQTIPDCAPLVTAINDAATIVSLQAMDGVTTGCANPATVVAALTPLADQLTDPARAAAWHRPARALTALARVAPDEARKRLPAAKAHSSWQVRATAASAAGVLNDASVALELSKDAEANVRTAAIDALVRLKSPDAPAAAIAALSSEDHQLVRSAARALQATTHADAVSSLFTALRRLTIKGADTSRDPRVAIVDRLAELLGPTRAGELSEWARDWDGAVSAAAVRALTAAKVTVPSGSRQYRAPVQPTAADLRDVLTARQADIVMADGGTITLSLLTGDAPMAVARFVTRARSGAYNGLTFHRVVANFVVQGLSPGANEYVGDDRFMRDDVSLQSHTRGAVGISTRGYDTGDAQIFFDLIDVPRLDHDYTVFARVTAGIEHVDAILEGAVVTRVVIR